MAKHRFHSQIPVFNLADRYTFFNDLMVPTNFPMIDLQKRALYRHAANHYNHTFQDFIDEANKPSEIISGAIEFLGSAAKNERNKEIHAIEYYLESLESQIPPKLSKQRTFKNIIKDLKKMSSNLANGKVEQQDIENFYVELTSYINMIKQNIVDFQARVHQIANDNKDDRGMRAELAAIRLKSDYSTLFKSISGTQKKNAVNSFSSRVRNIATDYLINYMKKNINIDFSDHFPAVLAGIIADFEHYVQHDRNASGDYMRALDKISKSDLLDLFERYITQCDTLYLKRFSNYTKGINVDEFTDALDRFESTLGLKLLGNNSEQAKSQLAEVKRQEALMHKNNLNGRNYVSRALKNNGFKNIADYNELLSWSFDTQTGHGRVYEAIRDLIFNEFSVGTRGGATDSVALGQIQGTVNTELIEQIVDQHFNMMADAIGDTIIQKRTSRLDDYSIAVQKANDKMTEIEKDLGQTLASLESVKIEDIFIYHNSLKLYSSVEVDEGGKRRTTKFHGREIQAFSALDNLFSLADLNIVQIPDKDMLYGLVLNLAEGAVAHSQLPLVENYLSIFAGLLLFSDIRDMALELAHQAVQGVSYQTPTKVHLYLLNDTYVPGSMILTYIYQTLYEGYTKINVRDGARVDIKTTAPAKSISTYLNARLNGAPYDIEDWDNMADTIASNTLIQINFLSSYVSFIKKIAKTI